MSDVTMQELELETAELLPARETLTRSCGCQSHGGFALVNVSGNNILDGNNVNVLGIANQNSSGNVFYAS
jgi:hypothetical protein